MEKKYEFTENVLARRICGEEVVLHQIRALKDFVVKTATLLEEYEEGKIAIVFKSKEIKEGDLGGWIESENNLSQLDKAWIEEGSIVCRNAVVYGDAWVGGQCIITSEAKIYGDACVTDKSEIMGAAKIYGSACVMGVSVIAGTTKIHDKSKVINSSAVGGTEIKGNAVVDCAVVPKDFSLVDSELIKSNYRQRKAEAIKAAKSAKTTKIASVTEPAEAAV